MNLYFKVFDYLFEKLLPKLFRHFENIKLQSQTFLIEWIYTVFCRQFNLNTTLNIWDLLI